ncbi:MAG: hypothetical protein JXB45_08950 [Candidatus Krumholzibacteriota bacterium]|nr:hypothetical protein [Candidatus Krumholzibacteriota bacterium]
MEKFGLVSLLVICLLLCGCTDHPGIQGTGSGNGVPDYDLIIDDLAGNIELGYGEKVFIRQDDLCIEFAGVQESRCPMGVVCFWEGEGIASLRLSRPGIDPVPAEPRIRPGRDPDIHTDLKVYALDYIITLLALEPYPDISRVWKLSDYVATLRVEKCPDPSGLDHVIFTRSDPSRLGKDAVVLTGAEISGKILTLAVRYGGGCREHSFSLYMHPVFKESYPVQADLYLRHDGHHDTCKAIVPDEVSFDLRRIGELYKDLYGRYDDIILHVRDCLQDNPAEVFTVTYRPE